MRAADHLPAIETALAEQGAPAGGEIRLAEPEQLVPDNATLVSMSFNPQSGRFIARLAGGGDVVVIAGSARKPVEAPVLVAAKARGDMISESDIAYVETADVLPTDVILETEALVGAEARRDLRAGAPLRRSDIAERMLIKKKALVTVAYESPGLWLSQTGVAQANGAQGDVIAVEIAGSGRIVRAVVEGENHARIVRAPGRERSGS
jgi:flagella basal body P-ring formation protein FlgA